MTIALRPRPLRRALLLGALSVAAGALAIGLGVGSTSKADVREAILALPKNAPFAAALRTVELPGDPDSPAYAAHFPSPEAAETPERPIVIVHGSPDTMGSFAPLLFGPGQLHGQANLWTLEICGHGIAPANGDAYPFQRCADYLASVLEAFDLKAVTLVGNSYGAEYCWRAAADHPDRIARLVLIDPSGLPRADDEYLSEEVKMREWSVARLGYLANSEPRVASALDPHFNGHADPERAHEVFLGLQNRSNWNAMIDLVRDDNGDREHDLTKIQAPTLLLWGEHDEVYAPTTYGRTFEERIPNAQLVVIDGAGHYPHEQEPARVAKEILAFHRAGL